MNIPSDETEFRMWLRNQYTAYGDSFAHELFVELRQLRSRHVEIAPETIEQIAKTTASLIINGGTFNLRDLVGGDITKRDETQVGRDMNTLDVGENASVEEAAVGQGTQQKES